MYTYTPTVYLLLIYRNRSVDSLWLWVSPLFILLLDLPRRWRLAYKIYPYQRTILTSPEGDATHYLHLISTVWPNLYRIIGLFVNLTPGRVKDEACVLWPSRRLVERLRILSLLRVAPYYLFVNPKVYLTITRDGYFFNTFKELFQKVVNLYI